MSCFFLLYDDYYKICDDLLNKSVENKNVYILESTINSICSVGDCTKDMKILKKLIEIFKKLINLSIINEDFFLKVKFLELIDNFGHFIVNIDIEIIIWCINFIIKSLVNDNFNKKQNQLIKKYSTNAFISLTENFSKNDIKIKKVLLNFIEKIMKIIDNFDFAIVLELYKGISNIILIFDSNEEELENQKNILILLIKPIINILNEYLNLKEEDINMNVVNNIIFEFSKFDAIIKGFDGSKLNINLINLIEKIIDIFNKICIKYYNFEIIIEKYSELMKSIICSIGKTLFFYYYIH
jgi:hypothetical protein